MAVKSPKNKIPKTPKPPTRREIAMYHGGAYEAVVFRLGDELKNDNITVTSEYPLSKRPPRVDIMLIKKKRDVVMEPSWSKIFRGYNIIEYKSPVVPPVSIFDYNKVVHAYAGLYSSQENVPFADMSATIMCFKRPETLFDALREELNCRVLRKGRGIYYVVQRGAGVNVGKMLAVQVVVYSELTDADLLLKALRPDIDRATARKVVELPLEDEEGRTPLVTWWEVMSLRNGITLSMEADMKKYKGINLYVKELSKRGLLTEFEQGLRQETRKELFELLQNGYTIEELKKMMYANQN